MRVRDSRSCGARPILSYGARLSTHDKATTPDVSFGHRINDNGAQLRRVVLASFIGTTIEWYDFFLYGTAAALVFNKLFFPTLEPLAGTLSSYGTFAVGFVA